MASGATLLATCATCPYYRPVLAAQGECRANPPTPFILPGPPDALGQPQVITRGFWAPVGLADYCGKHPTFGAPMPAWPPGAEYVATHRGVAADAPATANGEAEHGPAAV